MRFFFIDRICEFDRDRSLRGTYAVPRTLVFPAGRPDRAGPAPPLLLEVLAQAGGWLIKASSDFEILAILSVVRNFRIDPIVPLVTTLSVETELVHRSDRLVSVAGRLALPNGEIVASVDSMSYVLIRTPAGAKEWEERAWAVMTRRRTLSILESRR